jgi:hypothetical protein
MPGLLRFVFAQQHLTQKGRGGKSGRASDRLGKFFPGDSFGVLQGHDLFGQQLPVHRYSSIGGNHAEHTRQDFMRILIS